MIDTYLFDWGDTLMVDFPNQEGKMSEWPKVEAVIGAQQVLALLSRQAKIYIATGAQDSSVMDIKKAFSRVGLSAYISGYFCENNIGLAKGSPEFLSAILTALDKPATSVALVGDSFKKDIEPAVAVGIHPIWLTKSNIGVVPDTVQIITNLIQLCKP